MNLLINQVPAESGAMSSTEGVRGEASLSGVFLFTLRID